MKKEETIKKITRQVDSYLTRSDAVVERARKSASKTWMMFRSVQAKNETLEKRIAELEKEKAMLEEQNKALRTDNMISLDKMADIRDKFRSVEKDYMALTHSVNAKAEEREKVMWELKVELLKQKDKYYMLLQESHEASVFASSLIDTLISELYDTELKLAEEKDEKPGRVTLKVYISVETYNKEADSLIMNMITQEFFPLIQERIRLLCRDKFDVFFPSKLPPVKE